LIAYLYVRKKFRIYWCVFDLSIKEKDLAKLRFQSELPDFWNTPDTAQKIMKRIASLNDEINDWHIISRRIADAIELAEIDDINLRVELEKELVVLENEVEQREIKAMLSGKYDQGDAILAIHSGAGGIDAQDWA
jgi:peptide chain release factor 2